MREVKAAFMMTGEFLYFNYLLFMLQFPIWSHDTKGVVILGDDAEFYMEMQEEERRYEQMLRYSYYIEDEDDIFNKLYLVDGDNHVYEGLDGIDNIGTFGKVIVFVSQEGLRNNLIKRYGDRINIVMVRPGEDAVDNRIKGILGNRIKQRKTYQKIYVISHDNGYRNLVDKYQKKYKLSAGYLSLRKAIKYCQ